MRYFDITEDGTYLLSTRFQNGPETGIFIKGDNPNGSFTFGALDDDGSLFPMPDSVQDESFNMSHGTNVMLGLVVTGYTGTLTRIGVSS